MSNSTGQVISTKELNSERASSSTVNQVLESPDSVVYRILAKRVLLWLLGLTLALNITGVLARGIEYLLGYEETTPLVHLFHVSEEGNITTWFSAMLLFISSMLLAIIASILHRQKQRYVMHWRVLSAIFFYMCLDEAAVIHELTIVPLRSMLNATGILYFTWVILAIPLVLLFVIFFAKFLLDLPRDSSLLFILAGGIFVFGAVGMDMAAGYTITHQVSRFLQPVLITVEELSENVGIVIFIYALLSHIRSHLQVHHIQVFID